MYVSSDLNRDGWRDIIAHSHDQQGNVDIMENKETSPGLTMQKSTLPLSGYVASVVQPGDIDGDGAVDVIVGINNGKFAFMKNKTAPNGTISNTSFEKFAEYGLDDNAGAYQYTMSINDLNGDGRPEIINTYYYNSFPHGGYQMEIWQNSPTNCIDPSLVTLSVTNYLATIILPPNTTQDQFEIDYTTVGSSYWSRVYGTTFYISNGYTYQLRVRAKCYAGFTDYYYIDFKPECVNTNSFSVSNIGIDNVTLYASDLSSFEVQYSLAGQNQWTDQPQYSNQITNLLPGALYDIRFRGRCGDNTVDYKYKQFTTLCPRLSRITATPLLNNTAEISWSSAYAGTAVLEYSIDNVNWTLIDETLMMHALTPGTQYFVRGHMACTNINSDFVYTTFTAVCPKVSSLSVDAVTPFGARVNWVDDSGSDSFVLTYSTPGGAATTAETSATFFNLDGLNPGSPYTVSVAPQCSAKNFAVANFNTVCYVPLNLSADAITYTSAELLWDTDFTGYPYTIEYAIKGSNTWLKAETSATNISLINLSPGITYEARVHIHCSSETLAYASVVFTTAVYPETTYAPNPTESKVTVYPSKNLIGNNFHIYDNMGRIVASGKLQDYTFDFSGLTPGVYTLKIEREAPMRIVRR